MPRYSHKKSLNTFLFLKNHIPLCSSSYAICPTRAMKSHLITSKLWFQALNTSTIKLLLCLMLVLEIIKKPFHWESMGGLETEDGDMWVLSKIALIEGECNKYLIQHRPQRCPWELYKQSKFSRLAPNHHFKALVTAVLLKLGRSDLIQCPVGGLPRSVM